MIHVLRSYILFRMFREKTIFFSRNPLLQILATADTKSIPPPSRVSVIKGVDSTQFYYD